MPIVTNPDRRVVVTGLGCVTPNGSDVRSTWDSVCAGRSGAGTISHFDPSDLPVQIACEVETEPELIDVPAKESRRLDRVVRLALAAAQQAVQDAGIDFASVDRDRVAVAVGSGIGGIGTLLGNEAVLQKSGPRRVSPFTIPFSIANMPSGMISIHYGLRGPNLCLVSACATGAHSLGEAAETIARGAADVALAGGAEASIVPLAIAGFAAMRALSKNADPEKASRPFDRARDGFVLGEGAAVLVLESMGHARARGATPLAILSGYGASADGLHLSAPDESGAGAVLSINAALRNAEFEPARIDAVNAHATSTPVGDPAEAQALREVFGPGVDQIPVSATKSSTGHLLGAAGALEAVLSIQSIRHQLLPPTANLDDPDPACPLDHVVGKARPASVAHVLSNSFGFGGTNASLIFSSPDA